MVMLYSFDFLFAHPVYHLLAREFRGMWVATVSNIDWPTSPGQGTEVQRTGLVAILDQMAELNMNALVFQVKLSTSVIMLLFHL